MHFKFGTNTVWQTIHIEFVSFYSMKSIFFIGKRKFIIKLKYLLCINVYVGFAAYLYPVQRIFIRHQQAVFVLIIFFVVHSIRFIHC